MSWSQFHGDSLNVGFAQTETSFPIQPAWSFEVGDVIHASPVVDNAGNILIGNHKGELIKLTPSGNLLWRVPFENAHIVCTPAVDLDDSIYVVSLRPTDNKKFTGALHKVSSVGGILWSLSLPNNAWTMASPTLLQDDRQTKIFLYSYAEESNGSPTGALFVVNSNGDILQTEFLTCNVGDLVTANGWNEIWDFIKLLWDVFTEIPSEFDGNTVAASFLEMTGRQHPTVAIAHSTQLNTPVVVVADISCAVWAFQWISSTQTLTYLWHQQPKQMSAFSSPAIGAGNIITVGRENGQILSYTLENGIVYWEYEAKEAVASTASYYFGISPIYIVSVQKVHALGLAGILWRSFDLKGQTLASPAVSKNVLYVSTTSGLYGFKSDLSSYYFDGTIKGGVSSPAISDDGTVYVAGNVNGQGMLRAYPAFTIAPLNAGSVSDISYP